MKPYSQTELALFADDAHGWLIGRQLQDVLVNDRGLALGFWRGGTAWLVVDMAPSQPLALIFDGEVPFRKGPKPKPIGLFLASNVRGRSVMDVRLKTELGRVLLLTLGPEADPCEIEIHLIPKQPNVLIRANGKSLAWEKPRELQIVAEPTDLPKPRTLDTVRDQWMIEQGAQKKPAIDPEEKWRKQRDRDLEKKRKALGEIERQADSDEANDWRVRGDELKSGEGELPDPRQSRSWNIEECFRRAKQLEAKREGARLRATVLREEIGVLEKQTFLQAENLRRAKKPTFNPFRKDDVKGRKRQLENGASAVMGRSAADNMALLRRARAWDLWIHLRDEPSAHAIVFREKNQLLSDTELHDLGRWLAKESLGAKSVGLKHTVIWTECRHVRPIKGDRLGRVTYHEEKSFVVQV